jgi:hypothetical protein
MVSFTPRPLHPPDKSPQYPLGRRLDVPQSQSGRGGKEKKNPLIAPAQNRTPGLSARLSDVLVLTVSCYSLPRVRWHMRRRFYGASTTRFWTHDTRFWRDRVMTLAFFSGKQNAKTLPRVAGLLAAIQTTCVAPKCRESSLSLCQSCLVRKFASNLYSLFFDWLLFVTRT